VPPRPVPAALLCAALAAGCDDTAPPPAGHDPAAGGTVAGVVAWKGTPVAVPALVHVGLQPDGTVATTTHPDTDAPAPDPATGGLAGVVVFVRGIDPNRARPWDHPPASVEADAHGITVRQGGTVGRAGLVRAGDEVTLTAAVPLSAVRARGAAFFTLTLPEPGRPRVRRLDRPGFVELTSADGRPWPRAHLFVAEHACCAVTDAAGRFHIPGVPAGPCEVVAWHPNWRLTDRERDPESGFVVRHVHAPAAETAKALTVTAGATHDLRLTFGADDFRAGPKAD
jgi:hypothetical protein